MSSDLGGNEENFTTFYLSLPEKSETTVRFFLRSDFYTVHGQDAVFVAKQVFKSTNNIKMLGSGPNKMESLAINRNQFDALVRDLLLIKQYRVEVYTGGKGGSGWSLEFKGSPGNLAQFEDLLFGSDIMMGNAIIAIKAVMDTKRRRIGVSVVNVGDRMLSVCEFEDDEDNTGLEALLVQISPKELVVPDLGDYKQIIKVAKRCGSLVVERKASEFNNEGVGQVLNRLLEWKKNQSENAMALPEMQLQLASAALHAAIKYLELASDDRNQRQFQINTLSLQQFVHIDTSSAKAVGLIAQGGGPSLVQHMDKCRTPQGRRLLSQWLRQPLTDMARINERLNIVEILTSDADLRFNLSDDHLRRFPDLQLLVRKLQRKAANMQDCYKVYKAVERIKDLLTCLQAAEQSPVMRDSFIEPLKSLEDDMAKFQEMITSTLDMDLVDQGEFLVQASFSEELMALRNQLDEINQQMQKELATCAGNLGLEQGKSIKLESTAHLGYFFRTTSKKEERQIRNNRDLKLLDANKSGIRFQSHRLTALSKNYNQIKLEYDECQKAIVDEIVNIAVGYSGAILSINHVIAQLDVLTSFAVVSSNAPIPYVRPTLMESEVGVLRLKQARHPVLESLNTISFIPNDINMKRGVDSFHIITGPNMGGKSTFIRTIGISALLAHVGCFVPCEEAEISIMDAILARIGAGDCQLIGISTFMNEMIETSAILRRATCNSLVLIDELGRGTSTYEGCGLAWSIAKHLANNIRCYALFATHFQELTCLPEEAALSARNFHVSALFQEGEDDAGGLTLLYQVLPGPSDRSFGIQVAKMARLPNDVIQIASKKLIEMEQRQGLGFAGNNLMPAEIQSGENIVSDFLKQLQQSPDKLDELKNDLLQQNNRYISAILS